MRDSGGKDVTDIISGRDSWDAAIRAVAEQSESVRNKLGRFELVQVQNFSCRAKTRCLSRCSYYHFRLGVEANHSSVAGSGTQ
jgi:hypothetical protein